MSQVYWIKSGRTCEYHTDRAKALRRAVLLGAKSDPAVIIEVGMLMAADTCTRKELIRRLGSEKRPPWIVFQTVLIRLAGWRPANRRQGTVLPLGALPLKEIR